MYCRLESSARKTLVMMSHGCVKLMAKNLQKKDKSLQIWN